MGAFDGFPRGGSRFFHELALEQNREWFNAHKSQYESLWVRPMNALLEDLHARLSRVYKPRRLAPPKMYRIYRDVRFSKDKTPYKTNISAILTLQKPGAGSIMEAPAVLYAHFGTDRVAAAGAWMIDGPALVRYRAAVDDRKKGAALSRIIDTLQDAGVTVGAHSSLAKMPRGFLPSHPRAALLRQKGLMVSFPPAPVKLLSSPKLVEHLVKQSTSAKPLLEWLMKNVIL